MPRTAPRHRRLSLAFLLLLALPIPAHAQKIDTLYLANGDRAVGDTNKLSVGGIW